MFHVCIVNDGGMHHLFESLNAESDAQNIQRVGVGVSVSDCVNCGLSSDSCS
jgi:hypothetical protein